MKSLGQLTGGLDITQSAGDMGTPISGICYDSRKVRPGSLFVCMRGGHVDGHAFMHDAVAAGAVAVIAESEVPENFPAAFVRVSNSRAALASVGAAFYDYPASRLALIGITGTNGKTTTSLLIESILKAAGHSPGVLGTLSYRWAGKRMDARMTTPESLDLQEIFHEMLADGVSHVVMEVSSHALALGRVAGIAFKAGIFTNLSRDHLDFHHTMEEYFSAKKLLFSDYLAPGSAAVINADDAHGRKLIENGAKPAKVVGYSASSACLAAGNGDLVSVEKVRFGHHGIHANLKTPAGAFAIESPLVGRLNLYNVLAAVSAAIALGIDPGAIRSGIGSMPEVDGRLQRVPAPASSGFSVIVDYAHTPDAMEKALGCLHEMTSGRLIAVFGCGGDRDSGKRPLMGGIGAKCADLVIITSDNPRTEDPEKILDEVEAGVIETGARRSDSAECAGPGKCYFRIADRRAAIEFALSLARSGDCVFIGGKGHETYQIIGSTRRPFDDRLVVRDYFENKRSLI